MYSTKVSIILLLFLHLLKVRGLVVCSLVAEAAEMVIQALLGIAQCALVASPALDHYDMMVSKFRPLPDW